MLEKHELLMKGPLETVGGTLGALVIEVAEWAVVTVWVAEPMPVLMCAV